MQAVSVKNMNTGEEPEIDWVEKLRPQLGRLSIFPLAKVQLFPGSLLPLYVFEPRYREMTADCLAGGGSMAVAHLLPGYEADYQGRPSVAPIAGAGQVVAHRRNEDGTYNILLRGVSRVRILEELPPERAYREVRAALLPDLPALQAPFEQQAMVLAAARALQVQVDRLCARAPDPESAADLRALCHEALAGGSAGLMADALTPLLVRTPARRQELLEEQDVLRRLEVLSAEVAGLMAVQHPSDAN